MFTVILMTTTNTERTYAVLDIRGEQNYGRIVSLHSSGDDAREACDAEIERQLGDALPNAIPHLMWTVAEVDGSVGERVRWRAS